MSIIKLLNKKLQRTLFTTPSHNQHAIFSKEYEPFFKHDYSELEGFDNLSDPKNAILMAQGKVSDILGTKRSFFVTQGATTAMLASMKALINPGDRVLVARNVHKSVFNGLILTAGIVDWFLPETNSKWGIYTKIDTEKLKQTLEIGDYKVFIMTSPTYEGIVSDIDEISNICAMHGVYLIVDEAHGSLYNFSDNLPKTAIQLGADVSINSLHKTAGALNQSAILNVSTKLDVDIHLFQKALNILHTTSPSYPILANIEACISYLNSKAGRKEIDDLIVNIEQFKKELTRFGIEFYESDDHDPTKILLRKEGVSGVDLSNTLFEQFDIEDEMNNDISALFLTGIGTTKLKLDKLKNALRKVPTNPSFIPYEMDFQPFPLVKVQPVDTFNRDFYFVNNNDALLKISNKLVMPYPPGIGLLYPGEAIQRWHLKYLGNDVEIFKE